LPPGSLQILSESVSRSLDYYRKEVPTRCLIQVSVGIEHIDDIIADFEEALKAVP
jgi:O-acetylhomoserine/O-acetylserine sulfhydrylase-like pyridoxal-dependent enzyme